MTTNQTISALEILRSNLKDGTQEGHQFFHKFFEVLCNPKTEFYILGDLQQLAYILNERKLEVFIDIIALYDYKAAQQLDVLCQ